MLRKRARKASNCALAQISHECSSKGGRPHPRMVSRGRACADLSHILREACNIQELTEAQKRNSAINCVLRKYHNQGPVNNPFDPAAIWMVPRSDVRGDLAYRTRSASKLQKPTEDGGFCRKRKKTRKQHKQLRFRKRPTDPSKNNTPAYGRFWGNRMWRLSASHAISKEDAEPDGIGRRRTVAQKRVDSARNCVFRKYPEQTSLNNPIPHHPTRRPEAPLGGFMGRQTRRPDAPPAGWNSGRT